MMVQFMPKVKSTMQGMSCRSGIVDKVRLSSQYEFFIFPDDLSHTSTVSAVMRSFPNEALDGTNDRHGIKCR